MDAPKGARYGMPWKRESASEKEYPYNMLMKVIDQIRQAGAEVYDHTDFPSAEEIISPGLWDWYVVTSADARYDEVNWR